MSAYVCDDDMFDLLTTAAVVRILEGRNVGADRLQETAQAIFDVLRQTNYDSVNYRYNEHEVPEPRAYRIVDDIALLQDIKPYHLLQIRNAIAGYEYQACEHPGWATSDAYKMLVNLGEWVDSKLEAAGWVKIGQPHGAPEWAGQSTTEWEWKRSKGFKEIEIGHHRLEALRKINAEYNKEVGK